MRFSGVFFAAMSAKEIPGEIELLAQSATIYSKGNIVCSNINIQSIQNNEDIYLENGFLFVLESSLPSEQEKLLSNNLSRSIKWLETFSLSKAILLSAALVFFFFVFRYSLNLAIPFVVNVFPATWEQEIGENTYNAMRKTVFQKSDLSRLSIERLREKAAELARINGFNSPKITFHASDLIGANALAFPGGPIVVTDDLVILLQSDELILSVIAHELAHIQERHSLQQIIEVVGIAAVASVVLGSDDTLLEEASVVGVNLWANKNSRGFEKKKLTCLLRNICKKLDLQNQHLQLLSKNLLNIIVQKLLSRTFNTVLSKLIVVGCLHTHRVRKDLSIFHILIN